MRREVRPRQGMLPKLATFPSLNSLRPGEAYAGAFTIRGKPTHGPVQRGLAQPDDVALVLYTSGTTGQQKLVSLTHKNICCSANNICDAVKLVETDRCLSVMPLFHIHGLSAVFASLVAGSGIVCTQNFSPSLFLEYLEEFHPTWYTAAPTIHRAILESANLHPEIVSRSSLRFIRSASSPMPQKLISDLERVFDVPVIEAYGMTEAGPQIASNRLPPFQRRQGSVGLSAGPEVAIADEAGQRKPTGEIGEVVIRGPNVTNAFEGNGWLRTGDLGYLDADGYLFITGRLREMVNRGGEKISPREVDEALMEHPAVLEAVSFAVPHATLGESVGAAVVLRENARVTEAEIRKFAATRLAHFKIPGHLAIVPEIPKGPGGKVQRIGMAERLGITVLGGMSQGESTTEDGPRTRVEEELVRIFSEVLGLERIGIRDDFFHSGGHSLLSTQVVSRVMQEFDISLPMESLFEQPTVVELGELVSRLVSEKASASDEPLIDRQGTDPNATIPRRSSSDGVPTLLCPAKAMVPGSDGAGQSRVQHARETSHRRSTERRDPWTEPDGDPSTP